jgi:hypothetical protein
MGGMLTVSASSKGYVIVAFGTPRSDEVTALLEKSDLEVLDYNIRGGRYRVRLTAAEVASHRDLLLNLVQRAEGPNLGADDSFDLADYPRTAGLPS